MYKFLLYLCEVFQKEIHGLLAQSVRATDS